MLTHKAIPAEGDTGTYKQRVESETTIGDGETVAAIFASLGFIPAFTYEKYRTEWADGTGHCVIDETPLGSSPSWKARKTGSTARRLRSQSIQPIYQS